MMGRLRRLVDFGWSVTGLGLALTMLAATAAVVLSSSVLILVAAVLLVLALADRLASDAGRIRRLQGSVNEMRDQAHERELDARRLRLDIDIVSKSIAPIDKRIEEAQAEIEGVRRAVDARGDTTKASIRSLTDRMNNGESRTHLLENRLSGERNDRILATARAAGATPPGTGVILILAAQRSGSTVLFDRLRTHPHVGVEPLADTWRSLGVEGRRYPSAFSDVDPTGLSIEIQDGVGAIIPSLAKFEPDTDTRGWVVEKAHPEFVAFDHSPLLDRVAAIEATGRPVEVVFGIRPPLDIMWSMADYQGRDESWYAWLHPEDIADFVRRSLEMIADVATGRPGVVLDYRHPGAVNDALRVIAERLADGRPAVDVDGWVRHSAAMTKKTRRSVRSGSGFLGEATADRLATGPDNAWAELGDVIAAAEAAYERARSVKGATVVG